MTHNTERYTTKTQLALALHALEHIASNPDRYGDLREAVLDVREAVLDDKALEFYNSDYILNTFDDAAEVAEEVMDILGLGGGTCTNCDCDEPVPFTLTEDGEAALTRAELDGLVGQLLQQVFGEDEFQVAFV